MAERQEGRVECKTEKDRTLPMKAKCGLFPLIF
jgi:hypothetical protein